MDVCKIEDRPRRHQVQYRIPDRKYGNFLACRRWAPGKARWKAYGRNHHRLLPPSAVKGQHV